MAYQVTFGQGVLFDLPPDQPADPIQVAFDVFHATHPEVFRLFERFALEAAGAGPARIGARLVWERMRWETHVHPRAGGESWALNNNWPPLYARLFLELHPEHQAKPDPTDPKGPPLRQALFELRNRKASA